MTCDAAWPRSDLRSYYADHFHRYLRRRARLARRVTAVISPRKTLERDLEAGWMPTLPAADVQAVLATDKVQLPGGRLCD